jgi:hypothetical protein
MKHHRGLFDWLTLEQMPHKNEHDPSDSAALLAMMYETCGDQPGCQGSVLIISDSIGWPKNRIADALRALTDAGFISLSAGKFELTPAGMTQARAHL